jgi:hypothetical protein
MKLAELPKASGESEALMMAGRRAMPKQRPGEIEMLLPWHAAGTLSARDAGRIDEALARDPALAKQYAAICEECVEIVHCNEGLGAPSARVLLELFAAIDEERPRRLA